MVLKTTNCFAQCKPWEVLRQYSVWCSSHWLVVPSQQGCCLKGSIISASSLERQHFPHNNVDRIFVGNASHFCATRHNTDAMKHDEASICVLLLTYMCNGILQVCLLSANLSALGCVLCKRNLRPMLWEALWFSSASSHSEVETATGFCCFWH